MIKISVGTVGWGTGSSQCVDLDTTVDLIFWMVYLGYLLFLHIFLVLRKGIEWIDDPRRIVLIFFDSWWMITDLMYF